MTNLLPAERRLKLYLQFVTGKNLFNCLNNKSSIIKYNNDSQVHNGVKKYNCLPG
jgi:hypothetical protein